MEAANLLIWKKKIVVKGRMRGQQQTMQQIAQRPKCHLTSIVIF
jgi:hypothetical protein